MTQAQIKNHVTKERLIGHARKQCCIKQEEPEERRKGWIYLRGAAVKGEGEGGGK